MKRFGTALLLASASSALATGFSLQEVSARGNALQGTLVGSTKDVTAVYFNPANLTELEVGHIYTLFGVTLARPDYDTRVGSVTTDQDESVFPLPHLYVGGALSDDWYAGLGFYSEYGLGTCYEGRAKWPLSFDSTKTTIESFSIVPSVAWKATDTLSFGAGLRVMYISFLYERYLPPYASTFKVDADDWAVAWQASAAWQATETIRLGLVYRSESEFNASGDATLSPLGIRTGVSGTLTMPQSVSAGINWQATDRLSLGFAATYTDWTCFDAINMHFDSMLPDQSAEKNWKECMRYSIGAEYRFDDNWSGMIGYTFDQGCYDLNYADTMCPAGHREQYGIGVAYTDGPWTVALDYMLVNIHDTDRSIMGVPFQVRHARTDTIGLSFGYVF